MDTLFPYTTLCRSDAWRLAQQEIVLAMIGRHVDEPRARIGGDKIAAQERAGLRKEAAELVHRMAGDGGAQGARRNRRFCDELSDSRSLGQCLHQGSAQMEQKSLDRASFVNPKKRK